MTYGQMIDAIMPQVSNSSELPFVLYRDLGSWNVDYINLPPDKAAEYLDTVRAQVDFYAAMYNGKDFANGSYPYVYDKVLLERFAAERDEIRDGNSVYGVAPQKADAIFGVLYERFSELSAEATEHLARLSNPLAELTAALSPELTAEMNEGNAERMLLYAERFREMPERQLTETRVEILIERITEKYEAFLRSLQHCSPDEFITRANEIGAMSDAHYYLTETHEFSDAQLEFYLKFDNPLKLVAQEWEIRQNDMSDFSFTLDYIDESKERFLAREPLVGEVTEAPAVPVGSLIFGDSGETVTYFSDAEMVAAYKREIDSLGPLAVRWSDDVSDALKQKLYAVYSAELGEDEPPSPSYERFYNGGTECFVLERSGNDAFVWMPTNPATPYVIASGNTPGKTEWDSGSYYRNLGAASEAFTDLKRSREPTPEKLRILGGNVTAQSVFDELATRLESVGRLPDEYFLLSADWRGDRLFPADAEILCDVDWGGSEGIYIDVTLRYGNITERFATGKTLGESGTDMDRMFRIASAIKQEFDGDVVHTRYVEVPDGSQDARIRNIAAVVDTIVAGVREPGPEPGTSSYDIKKAYLQLAEKYGAGSVGEVLESVKRCVDLKTNPVVLDALAEEARNTQKAKAQSKEEHDDR